MIRASSLWTTVLLGSPLLIAATAMAQQTESKTQTPGQPGRNIPSAVAVRPDDQRTMGVIVKAESLGKEDLGDAKSDSKGGARGKDKDKGKDGDRPGGQRLTINTIIPWGDWVRDQVEAKPNASPREQAEKGANSIATRGQPESANTDIVVEVGQDTRIDARVRLDVEEGATLDARARVKSSARGSGTTSYRLEDLKPGLFVEVNYAQKDGHNVAKSVTVVRPVSGPDAVADPARNPGQSKAKK